MHNLGWNFFPRRVTILLHCKSLPAQNFPQFRQVLLRKTASSHKKTTPFRAFSPQSQLANKRPWHPLAKPRLSSLTGNISLRFPSSLLAGIPPA